MDLDKKLFEEDRWLSIEEMSKLSSLPIERLKSKIHKGPSSSCLLKKKIKGKWYFHSSSIPHLKEEAKLIAGDYCSIEEALELIGPLYHDSIESNFLMPWISKGYMKGVIIYLKTCQKPLIKRDWVNNIAKIKRYRIGEARDILGITRNEIYSRANLPDSHPDKISIEYFPSGAVYVTEDEIQKLERRADGKYGNQEEFKSTIKVGDRVSGGIGGRAGRVEKIVDCHEVPDLKMCRGCKRDKSLKKKYIINGEGYCAVKVQRM